MTTLQKGRIFISYRRAETSFAAGRIYDRLATHFGKEAIFMDVDTIEAGVDFVKILEDAVQSCDVLIALIGKQWLTAKDTTGGRRLDNPKDFVRIEIAAALNRKIRVIPVLVDGVSMPRSSELPKNLSTLSQRNAVQVNHPSFNADIRHLTSELKKALNAAEKSVRLEKRALQKKLARTQRSKLKNIKHFPLFVGGSIVIVFILSLIVKNIFSPIPSTPTPTTPTNPSPSEVPATIIAPSPLATSIPPTETSEISEEYNVGSTIRSEKDSMILNYIPAGEFKMGSENGADDEDYVHTVYLDAYWLDQTEVTNAMYALCVNAGACDSPEYSNSYTHTNYYGNTKFDNYPVIYVSWNDAKNYCAWANRRLPTEAEWEKAARGGLEGEKYPWGNDDPICKMERGSGAKFDDKAHCHFTDTEQVASYTSNNYGLYDMAGNVWEWVADWYDINYYKNSPASNPLGPRISDYRVMRGGSWYDDSYSLRSASRYKNYPTVTHSYIGFRCSSSP